MVDNIEIAKETLESRGSSLVSKSDLNQDEE
jgi:hypothetical protein